MPDLVPVGHDPFAEDSAALGSGNLPFAPAGGPGQGGIRMSDGDMLALMSRASPIMPGSADAAAMTHQPEQPNPAAPYVKGVKDFLSGGIYGTLKGQGVSMPSAFDMPARFLQNEDVQAALGLIGGMRANLTGAQKLQLAWANTFEKMDHTPESIWRKTGWYRGRDDMWRMELPSDNFKLKGSDPADKYSWRQADPTGDAFVFDHPSSKGTLKDFIEWPELFKAYPGIEDMPVNIRTAAQMNNDLGMYVPMGGTHGFIDLQKGLGAEKLKKVLGHELQHALQYKEQFLSQGANINEMRRKFVSFVGNKMTELEGRIQNPKGSLPDTQDVQDWLDLDKARDHFKRGLIDPYYFYRANAGEIEADLSAIRHLLPDSVKKDIHPLVMQDVLTSKNTGDVLGRERLGGDLTKPQFIPEFRFPDEHPGWEFGPLRGNSAMAEKPPIPYETASFAYGRENEAELLQQRARQITYDRRLSGTQDQPSGELSYIRGRLKELRDPSAGGKASAEPPTPPDFIKSLNTKYGIQLPIGINKLSPLEKQTYEEMTRPQIKATDIEAKREQLRKMSEGYRYQDDPQLMADPKYSKLLEEIRQFDNTRSTESLPKASAEPPTPPGISKDAQDNIDRLYSLMSKEIASRKALGEDVSKPSPMEKRIGEQIDAIAAQHTYANRIAYRNQLSERLGNLLPGKPENAAEIADLRNKIGYMDERLSNPTINRNPDVPPPLSTKERTVQNYWHVYTPDEVMHSEPVWGGAQRLSAEKGISESEAFAELANAMWQKQGANRYITPQQAKQFINVERGKQRGIKLVPVDHDPFN